MYALERKIMLKTGHCPRYCWTRYAVSENRPLLEKVRNGQRSPINWRVVPVAHSIETASGTILKSA